MTDCNIKTLNYELSINKRKKRSKILLINLMIVGEMKLYLIVYDGGLLPPLNHNKSTVNILYYIVGANCVRPFLICYELKGDRRSPLRLCEIFQCHICRKL